MTNSNKPVLLLFIAAILTSCTKQKSLELEVINSTFLDMVGTHYYNEPAPPAPYRPIHPDSVYGETEDLIELTIELDGEKNEPKDSLTKANELELERDSLINEFNKFDWENYRQDSVEWQTFLNNPKKDKRNLILLVNDSLLAPRLDYLDLSHRLTEKGFRENIQLEDSWRQLVIKLVESGLRSEHLNFKNLTNVGDYQLRPVNFESTENDRVVASLTFSRVVFNQDGTKACYYYMEHCGPNCGYGYLVFVERTDGTWKLKTKHQLWIS
ncbi:hypothetical protein LZF95_21345 [Algoriphagus sp. AGSA1]|uniref:hypothetical protein n=1 Tax=Algoriphagus sp. AGSA1 TaxID=2907213 RepID=UPI001F33F246|nr:hypothetical protein [Algoriphagus sp. AGSA1]MCE7057241.1 hypothetical protein [Algoriphagus sp. AGSA1]